MNSFEMTISLGLGEEEFGKSVRARQCLKRRSLRITVRNEESREAV